MYFLRLPKKATVTAVKGRDRKKNLAEREGLKVTKHGTKRVIIPCPGAHAYKVWFHLFICVNELPCAQTDGQTYRHTDAHGHYNTCSDRGAHAMD